MDDSCFKKCCCNWLIINCKGMYYILCMCLYIQNMENSDRQERSTTYSRSGNKGTGSLVVEQEWILNTTYTVQCEVGGSYEISDRECSLLLPNKKLNATCSST